MDFNATIDLIIKDLNETREIIDDLKKYNGVPALQVELAKSKCKSAAEVIALLKTSTSVLLEPEPQPKPEPKFQPQAEPLPQPVMLQVTQPKPKPQPESQPQPLPKSEPQHEPKPQAKQKIHGKIQSEKQTPTLADKFSSETQSLHEKHIKAHNEPDVTDLLKKKQISSLIEAIGLNDKFMYIREIFGGDADLYAGTIRKLEDVKSVTEAKVILHSFIAENTENESISQLLDLVKRKLGSDE
jgi:hypothetical protein